ncbi:hypothetical protein [Rhodococcus sp. (in: high G+C Gram-positive bacteria)]|uniref:hypothetical protein n=1 Tax=Rhodococcus sp. TaxID=1831 RepID=UPI00257E356D|nr:hypothetical protein [Rhodococcus sp. (in: high G+C Gram-positive bacteria)]MBQ9052093.1 hypothetical protein [Rhodococcus sp. (in: high G+C Gram-positive bacteria)]
MSKVELSTGHTSQCPVEQGQRFGIRRFYYASSVDELLGAPRAGQPTLLDEFAEYPHERFNDGHTSASRSTKNFEHWDIAAATAPSGITFVRFAE